jgi:hypothetical protein
MNKNVKNKNEYYGAFFFFLDRKTKLQSRARSAFFPQTFPKNVHVNLLFIYTHVDELSVCVHGVRLDELGEVVPHGGRDEEDNDEDPVVDDGGVLLFYL